MAYSSVKYNLSVSTAATLGSGTKVTTMDVDAQDSICPRGWKMPSGRYNNIDGEWGKLVTTIYEIGNDKLYGINQIRNWPLNYEPTGDYYVSTSSTNGFINGRTTSGSWWSMTSSSTSRAYAFVTDNTTGFGQGSNSARGEGQAIRCVVRS